jgi:hypothetical protein
MSKSSTCLCSRKVDDLGRGMPADGRASRGTCSAAPTNSIQEIVDLGYSELPNIDPREARRDPFEKEFALVVAHRRLLGTALCDSGVPAARGTSLAHAPDQPWRSSSITNRVSASSSSREMLPGAALRLRNQRCTPTLPIRKRRPCGADHIKNRRIDGVNWTQTNSPQGTKRVGRRSDKADTEIGFG